jgi:sporulation protein YlmC with PRC-barrel domain
VRLTRVAGLPVVDTHVARQAGLVSDILLDVRAGRLAVLNVQHADGLIVQRIPAEYVYRLLPHTVLVADTVAVDVPPSPEQNLSTLSSLIGLEVLTDGGDRVGRIADADVDEQSLVITAYLLKEGLGKWRRLGRVHPSDIVSCSQELMIVRARPQAVVR